MLEDYYDIIEPSAQDISELRAAYEAGRSSDHSTQVGAVCGAAVGYNKAYDPDAKDLRIHAEVMAIAVNAKAGVELRGRTMFAPWAACEDCAHAIVASGISRVVVHHQRMQMTPPHWMGAVEHGLHILRINGVRVDAVDMVMGCSVVLMGEEVRL